MREDVQLTGTIHRFRSCLTASEGVERREVVDDCRVVLIRDLEVVATGCIVRAKEDLSTPGRIDMFLLDWLRGSDGGKRLTIVVEVVLDGCIGRTIGAVETECVTGGMAPGSETAGVILMSGIAGENADGFCGELKDLDVSWGCELSGIPMGALEVTVCGWSKERANFSCIVCSMLVRARFPKK